MVAMGNGNNCAYEVIFELYDDVYGKENPNKVLIDSTHTQLNIVDAELEELVAAVDYTTTLTTVK
jgi:hypothetical protein